MEIWNFKKGKMSMSDQEFGHFSDIFIKNTANLSVKIKFTKKIYKAIDSYQRREIWIGRQLLKAIKEQYGLAEAKKI